VPRLSLLLQDARQRLPGILDQCRGLRLGIPHYPFGAGARVSEQVFKMLFFALDGGNERIEFLFRPMFLLWHTDTTAESARRIGGLESRSE
jgi:hypothetical protein